MGVIKMERYETSENIAVSLIWDVQGRLLLIFKERKSTLDSVWMLPGGHSEPSGDRDIGATAKRENLEETTLEDIAGYRFLFYLEDDFQTKHRFFFIHEGFYLGTSEEISLPKKLLKKEGIKKAEWFFPHEAQELPISPILGRVLKRIDSGKTSFFHRSVNHLQAILGDARKNIRDERKVKEITREIKDFAIFLDQFYDEKSFFSSEKKIVGNFKEEKDLVVVVEDDITVSETTRDVLERYFRVVVFNDPTTTLEWVKNTNQRIKAIVTDYHFHSDKMTGVDLIRETSDFILGTKMILFTGFKVDDFDGLILQKPVTSEELKCAICS